MIDTAVNAGMKTIAITEHGLPRGYIAKALYAQSKGIRFLHGVEIYLTEQLEPKVRDNYHTVLIAKNMDGVRELNELISKSTNADHFYYTNRISFDEFLSISDNIMKTSACLASPLNKLPHDHPRYMDLARHYDFLEVQPHDHPEQKAFNEWLIELCATIGKPLIAGTDTHSSSAYKAECRDVLLSAKGKRYDDDGFDLTFKTFDELKSAFKTQGVLSDEQIADAIENTNVLANMCDELELDTSIKYPILYGSREKDSEMFVKTIDEKFAQKVRDGVIPPDEVDAFKDAISEELKVFQKLKMDGWMLSMSELVSWCKDQGYAIGPARGSVGGSRVAYVTDIIDLDPEKWHTVFSRFCNEDREEIGDIDIDCVEADRPAIFKYITERFGQDKVARVASYGTVQSKGAIDEIGRHLAKKWSEAHDSGENPWSIPKINKIKDEFASNEDATRKKYSDLFYYYDGLLGTRVSQSVHPAGMVISPISLNDNYGMFLKDGEWCLMLDMDEVHDGCGLAKYDFLVLKTVQVVRDACKYIGVEYPKMYTIDFDDQSVWEDMSRDLSMIFQFESPFAADSFKKFQPHSIFDMSLITACIRPSGTSYRDALLSHKPHSNPSELIDNLLAENGGYLVYQEDIIAFLQQVCGLSGSYADTVRRGIARKKPEILENAMPKIQDGYCSKSNKPREIAEQECAEFLKIIEDASAYMFGKNHSIAYCLLGYLCGYYRHYYPIEFTTAYLNNAANDDDIQTGTAFANRRGIKVVSPKFGISRGDWYYDREKNIIAKGLTSVKYMSDTVSEELYSLATKREYNSFVDLLYDLTAYTSIDSRQLDILIRIDYFAEFGNQSELTAISATFQDLFKSGDAKQIARSRVDGTAYEKPIRNHATWLTKDGKEAKNYKLIDAHAALLEIETAVKSLGLRDASIRDKVQYQQDYFGHIAATGEQSDRKTLVVDATYDLFRKKDGRHFGYSVIATSLGSGKQTRYTVFCRDWNRCGELSKGDIIHINDYKRDGQYFTMTDYTIAV
jgi:DNA polymerase-3 subunit alpha